MIMVMVMQRVRLKQQCGTSAILLFARRCCSWRLMDCISYMIISLLVIVSASKEIDTKQGGGASQPCGGHKAENRLFSAPLRMKDWSHIIATEWSRKTYMWAGAHPMKSQSIDETNSSLLWNGLRERQDCPKKMGANRREASLLRKVEVAHKKARAKLERALSSSDMWHFMVGYKELEAVKMIQALTHGKSTLQHFSTKYNMKFLLAFIKKASANALMQNPLIHVVEPLVPGLKIEGLTLAAKIRELESANHGQRVDDGLPPLNESIFSLKATLTANVLNISETRVLAKLWEEDLQTLLNNPFPKDKLQEMYKMMKYNSGKDQLTACKQQGDHAIGMTGHSKRGGLITNHSLGYDGSALPKCENLQPKVVNPLKEDRKRKQWSEKCADVIKCEVEAAPFLVCSCIPSAALKAVAEFMAHHAVVQLVEINPLYKVFNKWAKYVTQSVTGKSVPIFTKDLLGQGEIVGCADTGIDMDHCFFHDKNRAVPYDNIDVQARKVVQYLISAGDKTDTAEGHGTHVAGSIVGDTEDGGDPFSGMAPAAKLAFFDLGHASELKAPADLGNGIFIHGFNAGARIFSNSWGLWLQEFEPKDTAQMLMMWTYFLTCKVQEQGGVDYICCRGIACVNHKVGASFNAAESLPSAVGNSVNDLMRPSTVAPFSSLGPTIDGRIKPDILAPGMIVWSSMPNLGYPPQGNCHIEAKQGTSSSAPLVAGMAALTRQYFREGYYPSGTKVIKDGFMASGALLKTMMIHSAIPEMTFYSPTRISRLGPAPDYVQGHGRAILEKVLVFAKPHSKLQPSQLYVLSGQQHGAVLEHAGVHIVTVQVLSCRQPLRVTMVWMDPPAAPNSLHPIVNDLNLLVIDPFNMSIYPNGLNQADNINNVEVVHVAKPRKGFWRVMVEGARIVADNQPYAMVITGKFAALSESWNHTQDQRGGLVYSIANSIRMTGYLPYSRTAHMILLGTGCFFSCLYPFAMMAINFQFA